MKQALLLDMDNTLYPYEPCNEAGKDAAFAAANDLDLDMTRDEFKQFYQDGRRAVKRELDGTGAGHERYLYFKQAIQRYTGTHKAQAAVKLGDAYWNGYLNAIEPFDNVIDTLEQLHEQGIQIAVTTDLTTRIQLKKIAELGIEDHIDYMITSEETGRDKPAAAMFAIPLAKFGVAPDKAVMVGDSLKADIEGGNSVNMTTVLFNNTVPDNGPRREQPDHVIETFDELVPLMR